jgi:inhibitor of KinA sporulation pathway (predicted exonuclease)
MQTRVADFYVIVDLEATCCDQGMIPREEMEIIELGAVMLNGGDLKIESEFQRFVKPVRHPRLTPFCMKLTSIRQRDVDQAQPFPQVLSEFADWVAQFPNHLFCSWGDYDRKQLEQDCRFHDLPFPFPGRHKNIKQAFSDYMRTRKRFGVGRALRKLGIERIGTAHRGIDDARNIAAILQYMHRSKQSNI